MEGVPPKNRLAVQGPGLCSRANHADQSSTSPYKNEQCNDGYGDRTAPVGSFQANGFGIYDIFGNVSEMVEDCKNESHSLAPINGSAWLTGECKYRVNRGGSWLSSKKDLEGPAFFLGGWSSSSVDERYQETGFRVARTLY